MHLVSMFLFLTFIRQIHTISIPYIQDIILQSTGYSKPNTTIHFNTTCEECLCNYVNESMSNIPLALNCFTNETCQYFNSFPTSYTLKPSYGAKLYFLRTIFPNTSTCCRPNISEVLNQLQNATRKMIILPYAPGAFGYDETQPDEAVVIGWSVGNLTWFNPTNLSIIRHSLVWTSLSIVLYNGSLFTSQNNIPTIDVLNSQTMNQVTNITHPSLYATRKYIFLNDGNTMIATAQQNWSLTVFNVTSSTNYVFQKRIPFPFASVHSLAKVNDTLFYASSWSNTAILSYYYQNATWNYSVLVQPHLSVTGSHMALDDCGRIWQVIYESGLFIYDSSGVQVASWNITFGNDTLYDILLLPNYVLLLTANSKKVLQYDPQIYCL